MANQNNIPNNPGCYLFRDKDKNVIYVGKAKNLKKRVGSYFPAKDRDEKTKKLVESITETDFIITDSEYEALLLENNLIKKYWPKYNILLKDSKRYAYIQITDEEFPRMLVARQKTEKGRYYGPFTSAAERDIILETLRKAFQIRTCKKMPKKACLKLQIGLCSAPCMQNISKEEYNSGILSAERVLKGEYPGLIDELKSRMKQASAIKNFEKAKEFRDQISAIEMLDARQKMERQKKYDEDIINFIIRDEKVYLILFKVSKGILEGKEEFEFNYSEDFLEEFLMQYYSENPVPKEIILPKEIDDNLFRFLQEKAQRKLEIAVPKIGEKEKLLELVKKNIEKSFFGDEEALLDLKENLKLKKMPDIIECFDVSHLNGTNPVASMVFFRSGKPDKNEYRRFKLRTVEGIDDYAGIKEVVGRRYKRTIEENKPLPDLIIIDGGKGQISAAMEILESLRIKVPVIGLAKKNEEIFFPGRKIPMHLPRSSPALKLLQAIRDEAHRFAIKYNRMLRGKRLNE